MPIELFTRAKVLRIFERLSYLQETEKKLFGKKEGRPPEFSAISADQWVALSLIFNDEIKQMTKVLRTELDQCVKVVVADYKEKEHGQQSAGLQTQDSS